MRYRIEVTPRALNDIQSGIEYYNSKKPELGTKFLNAIEGTFTRIANLPFAASIAYGDVRYKIVKGFPFVILYNVHKNTVAIARVFNTYLQSNT